MPTYKKFTDFSLTNAPANADFVVGYNAAGAAEQRVTVGDLLSTGLAAYDIFVSPDGGTVLSGAPTSVEGLLVKNSSNIVVDYAANPNFIENLSASSTLGANNSAVYLNVGVPGFTTANWGTNIGGGFNVVNAGASNVQGIRNYVHGSGVQATGFGNSMGMHASTVEGICNTVNRPATIAKTVSATNTIFLHEAAAASSTIGIAPGQRIIVDGIQSVGGTVSTSLNSRQIFTVATATLGSRSFTVMEPLTSMYAYIDDTPYTDYRYVVGISTWATSPNLNYTGSHAEGSFNYITNKNSHAEGQNNIVASIAGHAEGVGNFAGNTSHAQGTETRAGMNIAYFDSYDAATNTFQLYTNYLSTFNTFNADAITVGTILYYLVSQVSTSSTRRNLVRFTVLSADAALNTVTALSAVRRVSLASAGTSLLSRERQLMLASGSTNHAQGTYTVAANVYSNAEGHSTVAKGYASHAGGTRSTAQHDYAYAWSSGDGTTVLDRKNHATTRTGQYMVSAHGGMFLPGNVGIGTDSIANALTVAGTISATTITADNIAYTNAGFTNLPTYKTYQTNVAVKNANWPAVSAAQLAETDYYNSGATYAMPGGLIIKGHSPAYDTSIRNLPGNGVYGLQIQNVNNMDPGTTFVNDGRGNSTHAFTFRAGISNFTGGSDHSHVSWSGSPSNASQTWQMIQGGQNGAYDNRFMVHTLPQYQLTTVITTQNGGYIDTTTAGLVTGTDRLTGVKLQVIDPAGTNNYWQLGVNDYVGLQFNPGVAGLVAAAYNGRVTDKTFASNLSTFTLDLYVGVSTNWVPAQKGLQFVSLSSRTLGGNPGINYITSTIGEPSTQYVGLTGNYRNLPKHVLARFTSNSVISGYKTGAPITLWVPNGMTPSNFIYGGSQSPASRYGFFDAYVRTASGTDMEIVLGSLLDQYNFNTYSNNVTAAGNAGWVLIGGSIDTVHRPTFGTTGFYFEREPCASGSTNWLSGGLIKNAVLGCSESFGRYSYGLGHRGVVMGDYSGTFAGDGNIVYSNNSVAIGGSNLISISSNQVVIGTFNNPSTDALLVIGNGTSNTNRSNALEVYSNGTIKTPSVNELLNFNSAPTLIGPPANFLASTAYYPTSTNRGARAGQIIKLGDYIYCAERQTLINRDSGKFARFNLATNTWEPLADMLTIIGAQGTIGTNYQQTKIAVFYPAYAKASNLMVYTISSNSWVYGPNVFSTLTTASSTIGPGGGLSACGGGFGGMNGVMTTYNNKMYYGGGFETSCCAASAVTYDWNTNTWAFIRPMPKLGDKGCTSPVVTLSSGKHCIYMPRGQENSGFGGNEPSAIEFWRYIIEDDAWEVMNDIPHLFRGESQHFIPKVIGLSASPKLGLVQAGVEGEQGLLLYDCNTNIWTPFNLNTMFGIPSNQTSVAVLNDSISNNIHTMRLMMASQYASMCGYKVETVSFVV